MLEMKWNSQAAVKAQKWASHCSKKPAHSPQSSRTIGTTPCGENIYYGSSKVPWSFAIMRWYNEVKDYSYDLRRSFNNKVVGHYTQVVWHNSNEIGCGMAHCPKSKYKYHYVCQYCPAGNYRMMPPYKKGKPCGDCPNACNKGLCTKI
ncbi:serotriflin-like [Nelusetta ayraudi]|uniref:serotriflin-like n=1 Tax=Nelusetta ayraudi TaxID=303726 RepID=UPI003F6F77DC